MKSLNFAPLYNYYFKFLGLVLTIACIILLLLNVLNERTLLIGATIGLQIFAFSKERIEDERVQRVRAVSLRAFAIFITSLFIALGITNIIFDATLAVFIALLFYIIFFNISLWKDGNNVYSESGVVRNMKYSPLIPILYIITILLWLIMYLKK